MSCGVEEDLILETVIEKSGLSIAEISQKTGIPSSRFSEWRNGKRTPKWSTLQEIANAIGVKLLVEVVVED